MKPIKPLIMLITIFVSTFWVNTANAIGIDIININNVAIRTQYINNEGIYELHVYYKGDDGTAKTLYIRTKNVPGTDGMLGAYKGIIDRCHATFKDAMIYNDHSRYESLKGINSESTIQKMKVIVVTSEHRNQNNADIIELFHTNQGTTLDCMITNEWVSAE